MAKVSPSIQQILEAGIKKFMGTAWTDVGKPRYLVDRDTEGKDWVLVKQHWHGQSEVIGKYKHRREAVAMQKLAEFSE